MDANSMRGMQMTLLPDRKLALDSVSSRRFPQEGVIDLTSIPDVVGPVSMEDDEDDNTYIQGIPGVRSLGIKRNCRNLTHTAPPKLQRFKPIATNSDLMQVTKTLQFSTAENPVAPLVKGQMETCVSSQEVKKEALTSLSNLSDWGSIGKKEVPFQVERSGQYRIKREVEGHCPGDQPGDLVQMYKCLKEEVAGHVEESKALKEKTSEEAALITKLKKDLTDANTEKETLIKKHSEEIEDLRTSFRIKQAELEGGNKVLRDLLTERNWLITQQSGEIEVLKISFSTLKSKVSKAFMEVETQNLSSNAETCGQSAQQ